MLLSPRGHRLRRIRERLQTISAFEQRDEASARVKRLERDGPLTVVDALEPMAGFDNSEVAFHRRSVTGSLIGNLADAYKLLDFCAKHGIGLDTEVIAIDTINDACKQTINCDVRFRYVIDLNATKCAD